MPPITRTAFRIYIAAMSIATLAGCTTARLNEQTMDAEKAQLKARLQVPRSSAKFPLLQPRHPESLRDQGGIVGLLVQVDETGRPGKVIVGKPSGHTEFDESAAEVVGTWRLLPGAVDGVPQAMWNCFMITFHPEGGVRRYQSTQQDEQQMKIFDQKCTEHRIKLSDLPPQPPSS